MKDLLYSLMLESHNDSAVAIAEHVSVTVDDFADLMNEKAESIGCGSTYFITPNGLDADDVHGIHHTTAADLAAIMRYCIMQSPEKEAFLQITRTESWEFADISGTKKYSCSNHNAFLKMMDGALTGKTGFTADAGYCYVGALENDGRTFIVSLLACGWPPQKNYKWQDVGKLVRYGETTFEKREIVREPLSFSPVPVENGTSKTAELSMEAPGTEPFVLLMGEGEPVTVRTKLPKRLEAPFPAGLVVGQVDYYVNGTLVESLPVKTKAGVSRRTLMVCARQVWDSFLTMLCRNSEAEMPFLS